MKYKQRRGRKKLGEGAPVFQVGKMDTGLEAQLWPVGGKPSFSKHRLCSGEALTPEGTRLTHCAWAGYSCTQGHVCLGDWILGSKEELRNQQTTVLLPGVHLSSLVLKLPSCQRVECLPPLSQRTDL